MADFNKNEILLLSRSNEQTIPIPTISLGSPRSSRTPSSRSSADETPPASRSSRVPVLPKFNTSDARLFANVTATRGTPVDDKAGPADDADEMGESNEKYEMHGATSHLPSLDKVLARESEAPLSQYNFYAYLREQWAAEENLTFWLDVTRHEALFRTWQENDKRKRVSRGQLEREAVERAAQQQLLQDQSRRSSATASSSTSHKYKDSTSSAGTTSPTLSSDSRNPVSVATTPTISNDIAEEEISQDQPATQRDVPNKRVTEDELIKSAKRIYRKYSQLNIFPVENQRTMQDLVERQGRYNPVVFSGPKAYAYHIMQVIYFPRFIQAATEMNLTSLHAIIALPLGIIALAAGIALVLYYVFVGREDRWIRMWGLLPIWFGWVLLQTSATRFLPPLVIFGLSEHKLFRFHKLREPAILSSHRRRALAFIGWDTLVTVMTMGVLMAIPSIPLSGEE